MSKVFFLGYENTSGVLSGIEQLFRKARLDRALTPGDSVAVKAHMGELGNITYLRPIFVRKVVDAVKSAGGKPFVTDTTTLYSSGRFTASDYLETAAGNGFTGESVGAPIIIADGATGADGKATPIQGNVEGCELRWIEVASAIAQAQAMIVVSHVKGHDLAGMGGALKNVAMGCVTKRGKADQHAANGPMLDEAKCTGCGICLDACPFGAIVIEEDKAVRHLEKCMYCCQCLISCPEEALYLADGAKERFQVNLAHAAHGVLSLFPRNKVGFVNFVQDITPLCDCAAPAGMPLVQDVGVLASLDPVAIDKASLDLIDRSPPISSLSVSPPDILGKMHQTSSAFHMQIAQSLGLGTLDYQLVSI